MVKGMQITGTATRDALGICEPCIKGKHARQSISKSTETCANTVLGHVFSDLCRPMQTWSHKGFEYLATFIDNKSCKVTVCGLKHKSDLHEALTDFVASTELKTGSSI